MDDNNTIIEINKNEEDTLYDDDKIVKELTDNKNNQSLEIKPPKKKMNKKKLFIIIGIIIGILLIGGLILYFTLFQKQNQKNSEKEISQKVELQKDNYKYSDGFLSILDNSLNEIGTYECSEKDPEKCFVAFYNNEDNFDIPKYVNENKNPINRRSKVYNNKYVFINDSDVINLYDIENNEIKKTYKMVKTIDDYDDYLVVENEAGEYGYISVGSELEELLNCKYSYLGLINTNETLVYNDDKYNYIIDMYGKVLSNKIKSDIKNYNSLYISIYSDDYSLIDYRGTVLLSGFDYINFYEGYVIAIKDSELYLYDQDLNKLNEKGIKIKEDSYNTYYIFDDQNSLKNITKPYTISINEGNIIVEAANGLVSKTINIYESEINKNYDYVNYLDGTLYFYSDKGKTNLIGKYDCLNKNEVTSVKENFDNCFIAKTTSIINVYEEKLITPIIGEKYVFINDTRNPEKEIINLYDLSKSQDKTNNPTKNEYQSIDFENSNKNVTIIDSNSNVVVAKNSSGNLGLFTVDSNGLKSIIKFTDKDNGGATKNIKSFKSYFVVERDENYLYEKDGTLLAGPTQYSIHDYINNKLIVKNKDNYIIYSGGKILSGNYVYVALKDSYFIGINDQKELNVYDYKNNKLLNEPLNITKNDYENSFTFTENKDASSIVTGYTIVIDDNTYEYNYDWSVKTNEEE